MLLLSTVYCCVLLIGLVRRLSTGISKLGLELHRDEGALASTIYFRAQSTRYLWELDTFNLLL